MSKQNAFVVRESFGTYGFLGPPKFEPWNKFPKDETEARFAITSQDTKFLAIGTPSLVNIYTTADGNLVTTLRHRMANAKFSPRGKFLQAWDNPSKTNDNFHIWAIKNIAGDNGAKSGNVIHSQKLSKQPESCFSGDETIFGRMADNALLFYDTNNFAQTVKKTEGIKVANFSISPAPTGGIYVAIYVQGTASGQPSFARLFRYPDLDISVASKSFFQADRVDLKWNDKGTSVLVTTMTDVDRTGGSYYGKTMLHYLDTKGASATVQTDKSCVIHASKWSPNSKEFCVISGKMPNTEAALFNLKCEKVFDFGIAARNDIHFNPQGNILLLCGFGNLPGSVEVWSVAEKDQQKVASYRCPNVTQLEWLNDGYHFITATTAPRMQVDNSYKIWDCTGKMVHEWKAEKHLFGVVPMVSSEEAVPFPQDKLNEYIKQLKQKKGSVTVEEKKVGAYVPLHKRKGNVGAPVHTKSSGAAPGEIGPSENDKKIRNLRKKLADIEKLKEHRDQGKPLEKNQLDKLSKENEIIEELNTLGISM